MIVLQKVVAPHGARDAKSTWHDFERAARAWHCAAVHPTRGCAATHQTLRAVTRIECRQGRDTVEVEELRKVNTRAQRPRIARIRRARIHPEASLRRELEHLLDSSHLAGVTGASFAYLSDAVTTRLSPLVGTGSLAAHSSRPCRQTSFDGSICSALPKASYASRNLPIANSALAIRVYAFARALSGSSHRLSMDTAS